MNRSLPIKLLLSLLAALTAGAADNLSQFNSQISQPEEGLPLNLSQYNSRLWQSDEGLPLDNAQAIAQAAAGYLWIGTSEGLARFDGARFTVFDQKNVPAMKNANIKGLCQGRDGSLWIATDVGGLNRLNNGRFSHYGAAEGLAGDECSGPIFADKAGSIWVATPQQGLCRFKDGKFTTLTTTNGMSSSVVRSISQDQQGRLWFATAAGVDCWKDGAFISHFTTTNGLSSGDTRAVLCDRHGTVWIADADELFRVTDGKPELYIAKETRSFNLIIKLYEDRVGNLWVGTYDGLNRVGNRKLIPELNNSRLHYGKINDIYEDHENNLWLCTRDGLVRLKANRLQCYSQELGLANNNIMSVLQDRNGTMCVGTWGGGLNLMNGDAITVYSNQNFTSKLVLGLCQDRSGHLWVGTDYRGGLFETSSNEVRHYNSDDNTPFPSIRVICEDHTKHLWVGSSLGLYLRQGDKLYHYDADPKLVKIDIRDLHEDDDDNIWVATMAGAARLGDHEITWFTTTNGLSSDAVTCIFEDDQHDIWLGTAGGGLNRFHHGAFKNYTARQGLFSDNVYEIVEDDARWLWMACDRGIFRVSRNNLDQIDEGKEVTVHSVSYGKTDGMLNTICTSVSKPSACKSRDGRLWFATVKGLCVINPRKEDVLTESAPPPVVIEELLADRQTISGLENNPTALSLPPGRGELEFHYAALSFFEPENNRYKYKLQGVDSDWVDAGSRQSAHYNNIRPGHYTFHVIACNGDGIWNETGAVLGLNMVPHFWQERWFPPAMFILAIGMLILGWRIRLARREEIERLRLHIAADLHDEIGSNLASIALLSQLSQQDPAETDHTELTEINRIALSTANSIREIVWFISPDHDTLPEMIVRMKEVAGQMLIGIQYTFDVPASSHGEKLSLELRRNFFLIFKEILHNVAKHSRASAVQISLTETRHNLILRVADNGRGFNPSAAGRGNGLKNLRLRSKKMGGTLNIASFPDRGTVITLSVNIP